MYNKQTKVIWCDEAGYTGNNLLSREQPHFVYSSVLITPSDARIAVDEVVTDHHIQSKELKGSKLVKTNRGRSAARWLLGKFAESSCTIVFDKNYSLAAKFFEYIFEPVLAPQSCLFYKVGFHRFVSTLLYLEYLVQEKSAEEILSEFETIMRAKKSRNPDRLFASVKPTSRFSQDLLAFITCHKNTIARELDLLQEVDCVNSWVLELSSTSLYTLLAYWGEKEQRLVVCCDDSQPLNDGINDQNSIFNTMINRPEKARFDFFTDDPQPLTFNLAQPIQTADSASHPGLQIADVFASSIAYSLKNEGESFSNECLNLCPLHHNSVLPVLEHADVSKRQTRINAAILTALIDRTMKGESLFEGMAEFISFLSQDIGRE